MTDRRPLLGRPVRHRLQVDWRDGEENLGGVFDAAERARMVLLFDEADALLGRRTEVPDAHDRYANLETDYLLARPERLEGLVILAPIRRQRAPRSTEHEATGGCISRACTRRQSRGRASQPNSPRTLALGAYWGDFGLDSEVVALTIDDPRAHPLDDPPEPLAELRAVLLEEHVWRKREGLV